MSRSRECSPIGMFPGTFDPFTNGHLWVVQEGSRLFEKLIVAVSVNPDKNPVFSFRERVEMVKECVLELSNVEVGFYNNKFSVSFAENQGASHLVRGVRDEDDFKYERKIARFNEAINPRIQTVFLLAPPGLEMISSSAIRGMVGLEHWEEEVKKFVPEPVHKKLVELTRLGYPTTALNTSTL